MYCDNVTCNRKAEKEAGENRELWYGFHLSGFVLYDISVVYLFIFCVLLYVGHYGVLLAVDTAANEVTMFSFIIYKPLHVSVKRSS
jgi:hypothetical protein